MSQPRDTLGPFPFRGLADNPANYGDARIAQNVEWNGDWMEMRRGTRLLQDLDTSWAPGGLITYCDEFRGRTGSATQVVVLLTTAGYHVLQTYKDGALVTQVLTGPATGRPAHADFQGYRVMFLPSEVDSTNGSTFLIRPEGTIDPLRPFPKTPTADDDAGTYRSNADLIKGLRGCSHLSRLFVVQSEDPTNVWFSNIEDPLGWPYPNSFSPFGDVGSDNDPISGLASFVGKLLCFSRNGICSVDFSGQESYVLTVLKTNTGAVGQASICHAGNMLAWLSDDGLLSMDTTGNVTDDIGAQINMGLRQWKSGFGDATLRYYPYKRQLWLCIPMAGQVWVKDLRSNNWSTRVISADGGVVTHCAIGQTRDWTGIDVPLLGMVSPLVTGLVRFESADWQDWIGAGGSVTGFSPFTATWLSHGTPMQGQDIHRLFEDLRVIFRDSGSHEVMAFWLAPEQVPASTEDLYRSDQSLAVVQFGLAAVSRVGSGVVGTAIAGVDTGDLEFEKRVPLKGVMRARWMSWGLNNYGYGAPWAVRRWRMTTRASISKRER